MDNAHVIQALYNAINVTTNLCARGYLTFMEYSVRVDDLEMRIKREQPND